MIPASLHTLDQDWTLAVNSLNFPAGEWFWQFMSATKVWYPLYIIILICLISRLGWKRALVVAVSIILTVVACDQLGNLVKDSVARLRPCYDARMLDGGLRILEGRGSFYGFYSAHAANSFGFAAASLQGFKNDKHHSYGLYGWCIFVWALLIAVSRVFAGKHYLGDILTGALVGILLGLTFARLAKYFLSKMITEQE